MVATRRMIPVNQAMVRLTNSTSATTVEFDEPVVSSSQRAEVWEVNMTFNTVSDSWEGVPLDKMTPTIFPLYTDCKESNIFEIEVKSNSTPCLATPSVPYSSSRTLMPSKLPVSNSAVFFHTSIQILMHIHCPSNITDERHKAFDEFSVCFLWHMKV